MRSIITLAYVLGGAVVGLALMGIVLWVSAVPAHRSVEIAVAQTRSVLDAAGLHAVWWNADGDR